MACPDFQSLTLSVLQSAADGQELTLAVLRAETARRLGLSEADLSEPIPSAKQTRYSNRVTPGDMDPQTMDRRSIRRDSTLAEGR